MKRLVVACDGTSNRLESRRRPKAHPTNVPRIVRAIDSVDSAGVVQAIQYIKGVGTGNVLDRAVGGLTGDGIGDAIEHAYHFIANNYRPGDQIFLFGFSRGAFTVRSLSGFLHHVGILAKEHLHRFPDAYAEYQASDIASRSRMDELRHSYASVKRDGSVSVPIRFLGVWDTVGSLGRIPALATDPIGFHDTTLAPNVSHAYHALAIHELRTDFQPTLWTHKEQGQTVEQVWFAGAHSNVGGGSGDVGLSNVSLLWMMDRARAVDLAFDQQIAGGFVPNANAPITMSRTGGWMLRCFESRPIGLAPGIDQYKHPSIDTRAAYASRAARPNRYETCCRSSEASARALAPAPSLVQVSPSPTNDASSLEQVDAGTTVAAAMRAGSQKGFGVGHALNLNTKSEPPTGL